jgi:lysophospholipase L1-like esterase
MGVCLVIIEVVLGIRHEHALAELEAARKGELCTAPSDMPALVYTGIPGKCGMNSRGYRDVEYALAKRPGVFRAVVVGDSVAAGLGVAMESAFPKVLEARMNSGAAGEGVEAEIIVLARNGYSTSQQLVLLEKEVFEYSPDVIVWSYVLNDPAHPVYHDANGQIGQYHAPPGFHIVRFIKQKLFLVREKIRWRGCEQGEYHLLLHCAYRDEVQANIRRIAALAAQRGVPVVFLIHPVFEVGDDGRHYSLAPVYEELAAYASAAGMSVLDLRDAYAGHDARELAQPMGEGVDPWHPGEAGHRIAAEALLEHLRRLPGLSSPP